MFLHPEMPSYEDQNTARDRMLAQHPNLQFCGAHLASLEWSVEELAKFLDRFPTAVVETAARVADLQYQSSRDRQRVRDFLIEYQDRVLYATDQGVSASADVARAMENVRRRWLSDWNYFATDNEVHVRRLGKNVRGVQLPKDVVEKIYRINAERFFDHAWKN